MPTCALSPTSVTPGGKSVTSMLTIAAPAAAAMLTPPIDRQFSKYLYAVWLPLVMLGMTLLVGSKKERPRYWVLCGFFLSLLLLQAGCGGANSIVNQEPRNYTVTVTGSSGALQHTTQVTVTVQ